MPPSRLPSPGHVLQQVHQGSPSLPRSTARRLGRLVPHVGLTNKRAAERPPWVHPSNAAQEPLRICPLCCGGGVSPKILPLTVISDAGIETTQATASPVVATALRVSSPAFPTTNITGPRFSSGGGGAGGASAT